MPADLKTLKKSEKMKIAEKHLKKYVSELKRHFDFSDFQLIKLLEIQAKNIKNYKKEKLENLLLNLFKQK